PAFTIASPPSAFGKSSVRNTNSQGASVNTFRGQILQFFKQILVANLPVAARHFSGFATIRRPAFRTLRAATESAPGRRQAVGSRQARPHPYSGRRNMKSGMSFVRAQLMGAVVRHERFRTALQEHAGQAEDPRFRALCEHFGPPVLVNQRALETYAESIDSGAATRASIADSGVPADTLHEPADLKQASDFDRLSADLLMSRQAHDTFMVFRESARILGDTELERTGDLGAREHHAFARAAIRLLELMFVENVEESLQGLDEAPG